MPRQKNSKFFHFLFSLIPGGGQMHLGFMKRGVTLMFLFGGSFILNNYFYFDVLLVASIISWFYSFFDSLNLNSLDPGTFSTLHDSYWFLLPVPGNPFTGRKTIRGIGIALVLIGLLAVLHAATDSLYYISESLYEQLYLIIHLAPRVITSAAILAFGIFLVVSKKKKAVDQDGFNITEEATAQSESNAL